MKTTILIIAGVFTSLLSINLGAMAVRDCRSLFANKLYVEAFQTCETKFSDGDPESGFLVGQMNELGAGVVKNNKEAFRYYRLSAELGFLPAQNALARMYYLGLGVEEDLELAYVWVNIAALSGHLDSLFDRTFFERKMTKRQIERAQALSKRCIENSLKDCG